MSLNTITHFLELDLPHLKHVTMRHCFRALRNEEKLTGAPGKDFLGLYLQLDNDLRYQIDTRKRVMIKGHYNLVYLPKGSCEFTLLPGNFSSFSVRLNADYLRLFADNFPLLMMFLQKAKDRTPATLSHTHLRIPDDTSRVIQEIIENKHSPAMLEIQLKAKFFDIILACLEQSNNESPAQIPTQKIIDARDYIIRNLQRQFTVGLLADTFDIEKRKFLEGFKLLFGTTVYKFITDARMKRAHMLLRDTTMPTAKIAKSVGYKNIRAFAYAFMSRFGYSHATLRKTEGPAKHEQKT